MVADAINQSIRPPSHFVVLGTGARVGQASHGRLMDYLHTSTLPTGLLVVLSDLGMPHTVIQVAKRCWGVCWEMMMCWLARRLCPIRGRIPSKMPSPETRPHGALLILLLPVSIASKRGTETIVSGQDQHFPLHIRHSDT